MFILNKVSSVQYLRGIAALMVILSHWSTLYAGGESHQHILRMEVSAPSSEPDYIHKLLTVWDDFIIGVWPFDINLSNGGVMLFFLVSGFVIAMSVERQTAWKFFVKRFFRIFPTLWVSMIAFFVLHYIIRYFGFASENPFNAKDIFANSFLAADLFWVPYFDMALWTLHVEVKFYLLAACLIVCAKKFSLANISALAVFISCLAMPISGLGIQNDFDFLYDTSNNFDSDWIFYFFTVISLNARFIVYMLIGSVIYLWYYDRASSGQAICVSVGLFFIFTTMQAVAQHGLAQIHFISTGAKALAIFSLVVVVEKVMPSFVFFPKFISRAFGFISNISYPLYLTHGLFGMTIISIIHIITENINFAIFISTCIVFPLSWCIHKYVEIKSAKLAVIFIERCDTFKLRMLKYRNIFPE